MDTEDSNDMKDAQINTPVFWFYWVFTPLFLWLGFVSGSGDARGMIIAISGYLVFPTALAYWILMPLCFRKSSMANSFGHFFVFGGAFCIGLYVNPKLDEMGNMGLLFMPLLVVIIVFVGAVVLAVVRYSIPAKEPLVGTFPRTWIKVFILSLLICGGTLTGLYYLYRNPPEVVCKYNLQNIADWLPTDLTPDVITETKPGWCDYVKDKMSYGKLRCRLDKNGPCSYAINKNVVGMDHWKYFGDKGTVLLFESKPGWNQIGGPELLESHGHFGKKGVYIYVIGGGVEYVEEADIPKLKWIPDKTN